MLKCRPESLWNWDFQISGSSAGIASTKLDRWKEDGAIEYAGRPYSITKRKGVGLGRWILMANSVIYAEAQVLSIGISKIEITTPGLSLLAKAYPFNRTYDFFISKEKVGTIEPAHLLTRYSTIDFKEGVPELTQIFCFWVAAIKWYYASQD
jgi:hypothetical protein